MTNVTVFHLLLQSAHSIGKPFHIGIVLTEHPKYEAQSCLAANAWQTGELRDGTL
jgi:hypothetical protein